MKIKTIIKNNILGFVIGAILFGGIGIVLATGIASSSVDYTTTSNQNVATVEDALDDLYEKAATTPSICYNGVCGKLTYVYWNDNLYNSSSSFSSSQVPTGNGLFGTYTTREALQAAFVGNTKNFTNYPVYVRTTKINNSIVGHSVCYYAASINEEFCLEPGYWAGTLNVSDANAGTQTAIKLERDMEDALGVAVSCSGGQSSLWCWITIRNNSYDYFEVFNSGEVSISIDDDRAGASAYCVTNYSTTWCRSMYTS